MYDPNDGRWAEQDPVKFAGGDTDLYRFVNNAPTDGRDPSGNEVVVDSAAWNQVHDVLVKSKMDFKANVLPSGKVWVDLRMNTKEALDQGQTNLANQWGQNWASSFFKAATGEVNPGTGKEYDAEITAPNRSIQWTTIDETDRDAINVLRGQKGPIKLPTLSPREGYEGYSREISNVYPLVFDFLESGNPNPSVRKRSTIWRLVEGFNVLTFYDVMERFCDKVKGDGWEPVPVEFRLTQVQFLRTTAAGPPRTEQVKIPFLIKYKGIEKPVFKIVTTEAAVPLAHFVVSGLWVFKLRKKGGAEDPTLYAISTKGKLANGAHAPYDQMYAQEYARIKNELEQEQGVEWVRPGRPYDREWPDLQENIVRQTIGQDDIWKYLRVVPGDRGKDIKKIIEIPEVAPDFEYPEP